MKITVTHETSTGHRLMNYAGKCRHPHGHNYLWQVSIEGRMDDVQQGLLVDFSDLKGAVREVLNKFDHAFVLRSDDYALANWLVDNDHALVVLNVNPTAENLAQLVADELRGFLGLRFDVHVTVWETSKNSAEAYGQVDRVIQVIEVRNVPVI